MPSSQSRFNVIQHCLRTTFTHLIRAMGLVVFGSKLCQRHVRACNKFITFINDEDAAERKSIFLKAVRRPTEATTLGDYIDDWLIDQRMTVTGITVEDCVISPIRDGKEVSVLPGLWIKYTEHMWDSSWKQCTLKDLPIRATAGQDFMI